MVQYIFLICPMCIYINMCVYIYIYMFYITKVAFCIVGNYNFSSYLFVEYTYCILVEYRHFANCLGFIFE